MLRISQALGLMVSSHRVDSLLINIAIFIFKVLCVIPLPSLFKKGFGRASAAKAFLLIINGRKDESSYPLYTVHYLSALYYYCIHSKRRQRDASLCRPFGCTLYTKISSVFTISIARFRTLFIRLTHPTWSAAFSRSAIPSDAAICCTNRSNIAFACRSTSAR